MCYFNIYSSMYLIPSVYVHSCLCTYTPRLIHKCCCHGLGAVTTVCVPFPLCNN